MRLSEDNHDPTCPEQYKILKIRISAYFQMQTRKKKKDPIKLATAA